MALNERETQLIAAVRELARGPFTERAAAYDREGHFPRENVADLVALGLAPMGLNADVGGPGLSGEAQMRIMEEMAYGDGSTAVAFNMHRIGTDLVATIPPFPTRNAVLADICQNGALLCAPGSIPTGELDNRRAGFTAVDEGTELVISGKTGFASMSEGATYAFMAALTNPGNDAQGKPLDPNLVVILPRLDAPGLHLQHNWDAMGLRGTASHDVICEGLRVPKGEALVAPLSFFRTIVEAQQAQGGVAIQRRALGTLGILAIWLGLSQAAFDFTVEYVKQRHGYLAGSSGLFAGAGYRSEQGWAQTAIGNMEHWLETGRIIFYDTVNRIDTAFPSSQDFARHLIRTVYHLRRMCEEVGMGAMKTCGAHAYVRNRPMERIFRDLMGGVVMAWKTDELEQSLGKGALGLPVSIVGPAGS